MKSWLVQKDSCNGSQLDGIIPLGGKQNPLHRLMNLSFCVALPFKVVYDQGIFTKWPYCRKLEVHRPGFLWNNVEILPIWTTFLVGIHLTSLKCSTTGGEIRWTQHLLRVIFMFQPSLYQLTRATPRKFVAWLCDFDKVSSTGLMVFHLILKSTGGVSWKDTKIH